MTQIKSSLTSRETISLQNCDKEPVHIPGNIQNFAVLIATDSSLSHVTYCSANVSDVFDKKPEDILGTLLSDLLGTEILHDLNNTLSLSSSVLQRERVCDIKLRDIDYEIWAHVSEDRPIIEFEAVQSEAVTQNQSILNVRSLLARIGHDQDINKSLQEAVIGLRYLTGFDRVLAYQFDSNGDGEVKAEARGANLSPFLGLRFPKWDIPNQAREIMKKLPLRMIADVNAVPIPLLTEEGNEHPLNLTLAASRGVSPIHMEYLRNMGVKGTMTLSIVVRGKLWGLFAFHHSEPINIGPGLRGAAELFVQFFSLQMEQRVENEFNTARANALEHQSVLLDAAENALNLSELISTIADPLCKLVEADGVALISSESVFCYGITPNPETIREICENLLAGQEENIVATDSLNSHDFNVLPCAGAIALHLDKNTQNTVIFFREEAALSVKWAGAPEKNIIDDESGPRLKPRGSFQVYKESVQGKSRPWSQKNIYAAEQARMALTKADSALFRRLSQKAERQRSIYIAELNHRVRNILSLIRSLSRRTQETSYSLESYAKALERRISALGAAHDLAANHITNGIVINELFELEAKPFENENIQQFFLHGEKYILRSDIAPIFALIVHELMTNCVKHGALSVSGGRIDVSINSKEQGVLISWTETGGPATAKPTQQGFGLGLIENAVPYELDGKSNIEFREEGLHAEFWLPLKLVTPLSEALAAPPYESTRRRPRKNQFPKDVLLVEDSLMLAIDMSDMLKSLGAETVEKAASVAQAKDCLKKFTPDFAILDISLREEESFEVAERLIELKFHFVLLQVMARSIQSLRPLKIILF
jgi:light-regulated signal transduction histidine kinase (bacteriophytochrome)/CheY-like chemotaxis protein